MMASSISPKSSKKTIPVALVAGTHTWSPTPKSEAFQDDLLANMREHGINKLDTARSYVSLPDHPLLLPIMLSSCSKKKLMPMIFSGDGCFRSDTRQEGSCKGVHYYDESSYRGRKRRSKTGKYSSGGKREFEGLESGESKSFINLIVLC
jgi:hypothetical protein